MANAYFYQGNYPAADSMFRAQLEITKRIDGPRHPDVADDLINIGAVQNEQGHYEAAVRYYRQALDITRGWYGEDSPKTADNQLTLARGVIWLERYDEADTLLHRALASLVHAYGNDHYLVGGAWNEIGNVQLQRKRFGAAESSFSETARIYRKLYGEHSGKLGIVLSNLGSVDMQAGDNRGAERYFRSALAAYDGAVPATNSNVVISRIKLGRSLTRQKRYSEAEHETRAAYEILKTIQDAGTSFIKAARTDLVTDYAALGRAADAAKFRAELAETTATH
jgi:serine/threonine-protein kinase